MMKNAKVFIAAAVATATAVPVNAFELIGPRWRENQVTINYIPIVPNAPLSGLTIWNTAMSDAVDSWTQGVPGLTVTKTAAAADPCAGIPVGTGFVSPHDGDQAGVAFSGTNCGTAWGTGVLAVNNQYSLGGFYTNSDIVFNSGVNWDVYSGPIKTNIFDFKRVAVHELGHFFGLGHEPEILAIMNPSYNDPEGLTRRDLNLENPSPDDIEGLNALYSTSNSPMAINLEEPSTNQVASGVGNIRGWAVADSGIAEVEIYIDNVLIGNSPYGSARSDVAKVFPSRPNSGNSGFSMAINWSGLGAGPHTVIARAIDKFGNVATDSGLAMVEKFGVNFVSSADLVKLAGSVTTTDSKVILDDVMVDGKPYRVELQWNNPSQQFDIVNIINLF